MRAEGQPLRHRARRAQPSERTRTAPKRNRVQLTQLQARLGQQAQDRRDQGAGRLRATHAAVLPHARAVGHGNGQTVGAGVEGQKSGG